MKAPPYFIIIPSTTGRTYYIKPQDILVLEEVVDSETHVWFRRGGDTFCLYTLLTAQEIHERILELEEANFKFTWGETE